MAQRQGQCGLAEGGEQERSQTRIHDQCRHECSHHGPGEAGRQGAQAQGDLLTGCLAPGCECVGVESRPHLGPQHGQVLAQVELFAELGDGDLALADLGGRSRLAKPARQGLLTRRGLGATQSFEQRAAAEDVQVLGIRVGGVLEALAGVAAAREGAVEIGQAALVESHRPASLGPAAGCGVVGDDQPRKEGNRGAAPPGREYLGGEGQDGDQNAGAKHGEPRPTESHPATVPALGRLASCLEPAFVLDSGALHGCRR